MTSFGSDAQIVRPASNAAPSVPSHAKKPDVPPKLLAWDSVAKQYVAKPGEKSARFSFSLTNVSGHDVIITGTETTCDCTVAKIPAQPWVLPPNTNGQVQVTVDLTKKIGTVRNGVVILISNAPPQTLSVEATVSIKIPPPPASPNANTRR